MIIEIAFFPILGLPLIMVGGLLAFVSLAIAAVIGKFGMKLKLKRHYQLHVITASVGLTVSLLHLLLGLALTW